MCKSTLIGGAHAHHICHHNIFRFYISVNHAMPVQEGNRKADGSHDLCPGCKGAALQSGFQKHADHVSPSLLACGPVLILRKGFSADPSLHLKNVALMPRVAAKE